MNRSSALLSFLIVLLYSVPSLAVEKLTFGLYANENPTVIVAKFRPVLDQIEKQFLSRYQRHIDIKTDIASTYQQGINKLSRGEFDFSRFGPASYVLAKSREPEISIIAVENHKGKNVFSGVICVREDSDITNVSDLRSRSFAFGGLNSTVGRYLSQQLLLKEGINAGKLSHFDYLGRHDDVAIAVATGAYDAGGIKRSTYKRVLRQGYDLRVISDFSVPTKPWLSRAGLDPTLYMQLKTILLEFDHEESLNALGKKGFLKADERSFASIEKAIKENGRFFGSQ